MAEGIITKVQIKQLPPKSSVDDTNLFIVDDGVITYQITADDIAEYISTNEHLVKKYILNKSIGEANGVAPLNSDKKINGEYITYGNSSSTAYEGSAGKILEENLDNHLTDADAHGYNAKIDNEIKRAKEAETTLSAEINKRLETSLKGTTNGLAELDENGKVPSSQLPSYVDDVLEGIAQGVKKDDSTGTNSATGFILTGETVECAPESGKIYIDINTNIQYRWSGSLFVSTGSNLALGETSATAYRGDRGKIAYTHSQSSHAPVNAEENQNAFSEVKVGSTIVSADSKTDNLVLEGKNISITPDGENKKVTFELTKNNVISALGYTPEEGGSGTETNVEYGTCDTVSATAEKIVSIPTDSTWILKKNAIIFVKFSNSNSATSCTLNVNGTGAKSIWYNNAVYTGNSVMVCGYANRTHMYIYDGTYWVWVSSGSDSNTIYSNASLGQGYGTCTTAEATVAKIVTLSGYALVVGGIVSVKFTYAVPASATLNINSRGAKAIYRHDSAITAGIIKAGDTATFIYNGSQYHLISIDRDDNTDTKNTTGATNATGKMYLVGAKTQAAAVQTYTQSETYIDENGNLCSNGTPVSTENHTHDEYVNIAYSDVEPTSQRVGDLWCRDYE